MVTQEVELIYSAETSCIWENNMNYNMLVIRTNERNFVDKLRLRGFIFLGEIKESLGMRTSPEDWMFMVNDIHDWSFDCLLEDEGVLKINILMSKVD